MGQCQLFRNAAEILYQISKSDPGQQAGLRKIYEEHVEQSALTAKVPPEEMHIVLLKRSAAYAAARSIGKSAEEAFEASAPPIQTHLHEIQDHR